MTINLLTPEQHKQLFNIYKNFPALSLQNKGYEGLNLSNLTTEEKTKIKEVETILKQSIEGFRSFQNFRLNKDSEIQIRLQYKYDESFTGVGYILLDELLNGFKN